MKSFFPTAFMLFLLLAVSVQLKGDDLPPPTPNIETIPAGAWIIPMDNNHQDVSGVMNLRAYGLAAELLWADVPLKWAIKTGKAFDDWDIRRVPTLRMFPDPQTPPSLPGVNFETSAYSPNLAYTGSSTSVGGYTGKMNGARSMRISRGGSVTFANVNIDEWIDVVMTISFAAGAGVNAPIAGQNLILDLSFDGGATWKEEAVLMYGNGATLNIHQTGTNTVASNPFTISIPEEATQVRARVRFPLTGDGTRYYFVDDIIFSGTYVRNFYSGPFIIMPQDTANARPVIEAFNALYTGANKVNVYKLEVARNIDIRHNLGHKPYIAVYNDGGNAGIHTSILDGAGFTSNRYDVLVPGYVIDSSSCYTFSSTPHWGVSTYSRNDSIRLFNLQDFLLSGGNFFAQCEGIDAIENFAPVRYQSTNGLQTVNTSVSTLIAGNPDMPFMQTNGFFNSGAGGSIRNYRPTPGTSNWSAINYFGYYFNKTVDDVNSNIAISSATKYAHQDSTGGNIFYSGGHSYSGTGIGDVNGRRMYLNSIFVPARRLIGSGVLAPSKNVCHGDTLKLDFTAPSTGYNYIWTGPNGFASTEEKPYIPNADFIHSGQYKATITTREGCQYTYSTTVTVRPKPEINAAVNKSSICYGQECTVTFAPSTNVASAVWYYRDSTKAGCVPSALVIGDDLEGQTLTPDKTATYAVVATSEYGCRDTSCITIIVDHPPVITSPYLTATPLCKDQGVSATVTAGYGGTNCTEYYEWRMDGGAWEPYLPGSVVGQNANDSVEIRAMRSCVEGCDDNTVSSRWAKAPPIIKNALANMANCTDNGGYLAQLEADDPSPAAGVWIKLSGPGNMLSSASPSTLITDIPTSGATISLKWLVTNPQGCKDSSQMVISAPAIDPSNVSMYDNEYCLTCPISSGGWYYFYDQDGRLLAAVEDLSTFNIGDMDFCARLTYPLPGNPTIDDVPLVPAGYTIVQPYLPRYWSVNGEEEGEVAVRLFFTDEELTALMGWANSGSIYEFYNVNALFITFYNNDGSSFISPGSPGGTLVTPQFLRVGDYWQVSFTVPSQSTFYLHPIEFPGAPLPIELISLAAVSDVNSIKVGWETASELNSARFDVERSTDGITFKKIGAVIAAGNSNTNRSYQLEDYDVEKNKLYYYRLKQVDFNGGHTLTKIVSAIIDGNSKMLIGDFIPNPTRNYARVNVTMPQAEAIQFVLFSLDGRVVLYREYLLDQGLSSLDFEFNNLPAGTYIGQFSSTEGRVARKLVKIE
jgi:hypothetical protein